MTESATYTPAEEKEIRATHARGETPQCPRCNVALSHRAIGGGSFGLGYSRRREWLLCKSCKRSVLFDAQRDAHVVCRYHGERGTRT